MLRSCHVVASHICAIQSFGPLKSTLQALESQEDEEEGVNNEEEMDLPWHDCVGECFTVQYYQEETRSYVNHWTVKDHLCCVAGKGCAAFNTDSPFSPSHTTPVYTCDEYRRRGDIYRKSHGSDQPPPNCCRRSHVCHVCAIELRASGRRTRGRR